MIIYRPHRGGLKESLAEAKEFETIDEMKAYIYKDWKEFHEKIGHKAPFENDDIVIEDEAFNDNRCKWRDTRRICTKQMGKENYMELYGYPQCIGMCATDYER